MKTPSLLCCPPTPTPTQLVRQECEGLGRQLQSMCQHFLRPPRPGDKNEQCISSSECVVIPVPCEEMCLGADVFWEINAAVALFWPLTQPGSDISTLAKAIIPTVIRSPLTDACWVAHPPSATKLLIEIAWLLGERRSEAVKSAVSCFVFFFVSARKDDCKARKSRGTNCSPLTVLALPLFF